MLKLEIQKRKAQTKDICKMQSRLGRQVIGGLEHESAVAISDECMLPMSN